MTTNTPISEPVPAGFPDEAQIARWANAFFNALPGADGWGRGASFQGIDGGASAARQAAVLGPLTPAPPAGGAGLSPTGIAPESVPLASVPAASYIGGAPGTGLPPSGVSGVGPAAPASAPPVGGAGISPGGVSENALPTDSTLYFVSEALAQQQQYGVSPTSDSFVARPDLLPGSDELSATLRGIAAPTREPAGGTTFADSGYPAFDAGGAGFSPTDIAPETSPLASVPAASNTGTGLPSSGVSGVGPAAPFSAPPIGGMGISPGGIPEIALTPNSTLYFVSEALAQQQRYGNRPNTDSFVARPDLLPGSDELSATLRDIAPSLREPPGDTNFAASGYPAFDAETIRRDFPILSERVNGRPLIWLDNGATTQKPRAVIDRLSYFYEHENSNVHRAAHTLAARATDAYENARKIAARFVGASSPEEIIFVRGTTEAINLVAQAWGRKNVGEGDEIIISHLEHHSNIVPWLQLAEEKGARLRVIPVDDSGQIVLSQYERLLSDRTKIVSITHISNALGTIVPIETVIERAHAAGAKVLIDGAQSVAHARVNVQALDADFFAFSGHKIFAPTGIGVLYGKRDILNAMPPWQGGGSMIADVTFERAVYQMAPARFEAGTGNLADAVGLGAALEYIERIGIENIARHEHELLQYATAGLLAIPGLRLFGSAREKAGVLSFLLDGFTPEEVASALDQYGIAVRAGHHCAQPILRRFGVEGTVRATLAVYNTRDDIDCLVRALYQIASSRGQGRQR